MKSIIALLAGVIGGGLGSSAAPLETKAIPTPAWKRHVIDDASRGADGIRLADINSDGLPDIVTGWEEGGAVRVYLNPGPAKAGEHWPAITAGRVSDVEDAVFADLDNDGSMDVVSSCEGKTRAVYFHWAPARPADYHDEKAWQTRCLPASTNLMMWMFALPIQVDNQHGVDLVAGGKGPGAAIGWFEAPPDSRQMSDWQWHPLRPCGWVMSLAASDMDGDGDPDLVFSDRKGARSGVYWLQNPGVGEVKNKSWTEHPLGALGREAMFLHPADLDRDGLEDWLVAVKPREILWLRRLDRTGKSWTTHAIPQPGHTGTAKAINAADLDGDGRLDLVFSCEGAEPPLHGLMWLSCNGSFTNGSWTPHVLSGADGIKHDLIAVLDLNGDGKPDVITTEERANQRGLGVIWYENPGLGVRGNP